jgi:aminopeptidase N
MREPQGQLVKRLEYQASAYFIDSVDLTFDLDPAKTRVLNRMRLRRNPDVAPQALRLDGEELNLARVLVNGEGTSFKMDQGQLVLEKLPEGNEPFDLEIFTTCNPTKNTSLSGLYVSQDTFFTQCEAEGFRRITYFLDRPDIMSLFSVTLRADRKAYPVLLSNGNLEEEGLLEDGRHFARWMDPHRKPCYLFALVAGRLVCREQRIQSRSGSQHLLQIYVRAGDLDKTEHAMQSLMHSIAWDEARFGLSLDLERFMIVATSDFNMGAMENKGLNIFNTKYVLANPATATDVDFANIESVVAHEYFHNWTGNRVTCRDWFQLSLKEGLTVFRDQEFSQDMSGSASAQAVKRIEDVRLLRTVQFAEDAGPMAHPVRPDSYLEINNFYTVTIYEKGAEVVRMMQTLIGRDGFAKGMKLYFQRHDGQAVTCDDFVQSMADANEGSGLTQHLDAFKRWYSQAGTPALHVTGQFNAEQRSYTLTVRQSCGPSPGQLDKMPFVIPIQLGLISMSGREVLATTLKVLSEPEQSWTFTDIDEPVVPSLLRGFSAPVTLQYPYTRAELLTLLGHDSDPFNRWEAAQRLCLEVAMTALQQSATPELGSELIEALRTVLRQPELDPAFKELVLTLPSESYIAEQLEEVNPQQIHAVREAMRLQLAQALHSDWLWAYQNHKHTGAYVPDALQSGRRALAGLALHMLCLHAVLTHDDLTQGKTLQAFKDAGNMTDRFHALSALVQSGSPLADNALQRFHALHHQEALVIDKWFALQASACDRQGDVLPKVRQLLRHPDFEIQNPNRARSLIFSFCSANPAGFHRADASGYVLWAEKVIEIDAFNPQVAARLARALDRWRKLAEPFKGAAREAIARVAAKADLSSDVREVVSRSLTE